MNGSTTSSKQAKETPTTDLTKEFIAETFILLLFQTIVEIVEKALLVKKPLTDSPQKTWKHLTVESPEQTILPDLEVKTVPLHDPFS
ncbi:MAG: hypothetical protein HC840_27805 [Leptolyngbyaceae cyanobacterium RM2_2_4]|nr:hypothetical protein [Leptolyngbyaceae cyanobacterium SM1_4_3]NJO52575.1 hypothetical protein [Leptolyngbyaceae cyanobacterium RM2_2_4]